MGTIDRQRGELDRALERERNAFKRRTDAFLNVKQTFAQHGHSPIFHRSIEQADLADGLWQRTQVQLAQLLQQIASDQDR